MKNQKANSLFHHHSSTAASAKKTSGLVLLTALLLVGGGILNAQATKSYAQLKAEHPGWIQAPGRLMHPDCVHVVPSGAQIEVGSDSKPSVDVKMNGELFAHYDPCPEQSIDTRHLGSQGGQSPNPSGYGDGWIEASQWELSLGSSDNIDLLQGFWHVPNPPAESGALVYLFNGISPTGAQWILQPVVQWGDNGSFGGDYYSVASWFVGPGNFAVVSTPQAANPSDYIFGDVQQTGVSGVGGQQTLTYFVDGYNETSGQPTPLYVTTPAGLHWVWAYAGVLEAYNVTSCSQFPGSGLNHFSQTNVAHGYPRVKYLTPEGFYGAQYDYFGSGGPQCHFSVSVSGNGSKSGSTSLLKY
jgi:hypothetical protein